jgi:hypothetical protein
MQQSEVKDCFILVLQYLAFSLLSAAASGGTIDLKIFGEY